VDRDLAASISDLLARTNRRLRNGGRVEFRE
jgi:hypothetical protein